jgi:hypothetical protein
VTRRRLEAAMALSVALLGAAGLTGEVRTIPTRPGVTQSFLLVRPAGRPVASVVLFAGGNGASPGTGCSSPSSTRHPTGRMGSMAFAPPPTPTTFGR